MGCWHHSGEQQATYLFAQCSQVSLVNYGLEGQLTESLEEQLTESKAFNHARP
jgi:hypothetical protein